MQIMHPTFVIHICCFTLLSKFFFAACSTPIDTLIYIYVCAYVHVGLYKQKHM